MRNILVTISDKDIFDTPYDEPLEYVVRPTSKAFVYDAAGNVGLLYARGHYGLPGGGVEDGETYEGALLRECMEEIGCTVCVERVIGEVHNYRAKDKKKYEIAYFVAYVVGEKGAPTTDDATEKQIDIVWMDEESACAALRGQVTKPTEDSGEYAWYFNSRSHVAALDNL
jgi:8-oxo-dGTP diphosphatase